MTDGRACDVSVIVPHYNDLAGLDACLAALSRQDVPADLAVEIIVADNDSPQGLEAIHRLVGGRAIVVSAPEKGAGPARNAAVATARGTVLAFTDSDCVPDPGWLRNGLAALARHDLVGGRMTVLVASPARMTGAEAFECVFAFNNADYVLRKGFTVTANLFCPAALFAAVGPFRAGLSEDMEWCFRARDQGYRIGYASDAIVGHPARKDWAALLAKWRRINRESYALACDRGEPRWRWLARTWLLPASILPHAVKALRSPAISGTGNRMRAIATLAAHRLWRLWDQHRLLFEPAATCRPDRRHTGVPTNAG